MVRKLKQLRKLSIHTYNVTDMKLIYFCDYSTINKFGPGKVKELIDTRRANNKTDDLSSTENCLSPRRLQKDYFPAHPTVA